MRLNRTDSETTNGSQKSHSSTQSCAGQSESTMSNSLTNPFLFLQ